MWSFVAGWFVGVVAMLVAWALCAAGKSENPSCEGCIFKSAYILQELRAGRFTEYNEP